MPVIDRPFGSMTRWNVLPPLAASLNWVRVARRFPVRIRLEHPAPELVRLGASASVEFGHGAACP